jgi:hypothetical protein
MSNKEYEFEIQAYIRRKSVGETKEEARQFIINNLALYADSLVADAVVSDGEEVNCEHCGRPMSEHEFKKSYVKKLQKIMKEKRVRI